jgi:hypothetical protein
MNHTHAALGNPLHESPNPGLGIRAFVGDYDRIVKDGPKLPKVDQALAVGELVPEDVALAALPQDSVTEVPQVTSYRFVLAANGAIAVVDPATRRVVQLIQP